MRDMMNYHCLRVFGRRVRRIGKHSPVFSVLGTRVHGCSDAELCRVPIQSTFMAIVAFNNYVMPDRLLTRSEDSLLQMEMCVVTEGSVMDISAEMEVETTGR